jgi:hypothetical protein
MISFTFGSAAILILGLVSTANGDCSTTLPRDCRDAYIRGCTAHGVYTIDPGCGKPFQVYCEMSRGYMQAIVILRRRDGSENFYRGWDDYVSGFGNPKGEFWIGLKKLHCLTSAAERPSLTVKLADFNRVLTFDHYSFFYVGSRKTNYKLLIHQGSGREYAMMSNNGMEFTTKDRDNDMMTDENCAVTHQGGWWYRNCTQANPTGLYLPEQEAPTSAFWIDNYYWKNTTSLKFIEMQLKQ